MKSGPILKPAAALVWLSLCCTGFAGSGDLTRQVRHGISRLADKVVEFSGDWEYWGIYNGPEVSGSLEKNAYASVTTTVSLSGGPLIVHRANPIGRTITDPTYKHGSFFESAETYVYNGDHWLRLNEDSHVAVITKGENPSFHRASWDSGLCYIVPYCQIEVYDKRPLFEVLADKTAKYEITNENVSGEKLVLLKFGTGNGQGDSLWLDPAHGLALREYQSSGGMYYHVNGYLDAGYGVWLPQSAVFEMRSDKGVCTRCTFKTRSARILSGRAMEELTNVKIPGGWQVEDQIAGKFYKAVD